MTCIVGIAQGGKVWIGADSASVSNWQCTKTTLSKVFKVQDFLIGYTTSFRMGQILQYHLVVPLQTDQLDLEYLVTKFIPKVRDVFQEHWFDEVKKEKNKGGDFLLGYGGHLYYVACDFQVNENVCGFDACGSGEEYALAAMKALEGLQPEERIRRSLEIAAFFSISVCGPFQILSVV